MILTEAASWEQLPTDTERFFFIQFKEDRTGHLVSSGGRQIALDVEFDYDLRGDELELRFRDSSWGYAAFRRTPENATRIVRFELTEGAYTFYVPGKLADMTYRWRLSLDKSPLPADADRYHRGDYFRQNPQVDP